MVRFCPNCQTERDLSEVVCGGEVNGQSCHWDLSSLPIRPSGWRPAAATDPAPTALLCPNGHPNETGDLLCRVCGADLPWPEGAAQEEAALEGAGLADADGSPEEAPRTIAGWRLERRLSGTGERTERYLAIHLEDGRQAHLILYAPGDEPDPEVHEALRELPRDHVPELIATGHDQGRAFEVNEALDRTLADLSPAADDPAAMAHLVREIGSVLHLLGERGLRHRNLRPETVLVRTQEPLDLVIGGFGSARLSEFDLDIVSPLDANRYTAPEAVAGGVAAASDWWSLGMVLLGIATRGRCFEGVNDQAFLIHVLTNGAPIPAGLDPMVERLLRGLLALDRRERWGWDEVQRWLDGDPPPPPASRQEETDGGSTRVIRLGGQPYRSAARFALAVADGAHWAEARQSFLMGTVGTWAEEAGLSPDRQSALNRLARMEEVSEDLRLALALRVLNPAMPLVCRGEIVTPAWLLAHPEEGYALITGPIPDLLAEQGEEPWLTQLKQRALRVRERAAQLAVTVEEGELRVHLLSTSRSRMAQLWEERRRLLPDTDHPGLLAMMERRKTSDEDYILLLSADVGAFRTAEAIVSDAARTAASAGVRGFDAAEAEARLGLPRREIYAEIDRRLEAFARCGIERVDEWADQFRLERRLPITRALALLAVPADAWKPLPKQRHVASLLDFFSKRVGNSVLNVLTRLSVGRNSVRIDLTELGSGPRPASMLLDHLLLRNGKDFALDPEALRATAIEQRIRRLHGRTTLYLRDTGIDGLYLGFPFLTMPERDRRRPPRIAPVLLWPMRLLPEIGARGQVKLAFDTDRQEVRLNPAFETLLGPEATSRWKEVAEELLGRASLRASDVMDAFSALAKVDGRSLGALPDRQAVEAFDDDRLACAAVLFHLAYMGQAVIEDLRQLQSLPLQGSGVATVLRLDGPAADEPQAGGTRPERGPSDRFLTAASDPSQEAAVLGTHDGPGLVVDGPPGTGKSQTIVNMVADAIGRRRSVLIVCQKQAALEVVHKRLEAEGLGDRIMMVADVHKDRGRVVQAIRDQLDLLRARSAGALAWRQRRQETAARLGTVEADLDRHHELLHAEDPGCGLSYRQLLADLIGLEQGGDEGQEGDRPPAVDVPGLRSLLGPLHLSEVSGLQESCAPLARSWRAARFEGSPLAVLGTFGADPAVAAMVEQACRALSTAEDARTKVLERTPGAFAMDDPQPYAIWAQTNGARLAASPVAARQRTARWFAAGIDAAAMAKGIAAADETAAALERIDPAADRAAADVATTLDDRELAHWGSLSKELLTPTGFLGGLSPRRWARRRRLRRFMTEHGLRDPAELLAALRIERSLRPHRHRLGQLHRDLNEEAAGLSGMTPDRLVATARALQRRLEESREIVDGFARHPQAEAARQAMLAASAEAVGDLLDRAEQGAARHRARSASREAMEGLRPWFTEAWTEARRSAIAGDRPADPDLDRIMAALPTLGAYQQFRARAQTLGATAMAVFAALHKARTAIDALPEALVDGEVRRAIGREARLAWKARLELERPDLLADADELRAKAVALAGLDAELRQLNRQLLIDGIDPDRLGSPRAWEDLTRLRGPRARRLREILERGPELGLMELRPVWLMSPDVASRMLPLRSGLFDLVIYDEASQMPVEYALPSLYRGKRLVVSGDEKQMPPTSFFSTRVEIDEPELPDEEDVIGAADDPDQAEIAESWDRREIKDCPDLLQLARTVLPTTTLAIHYRSAYRELIQFSNASFYADQLNIPVRHPPAEILRARPIELLRVDGVYQKQTNREEAERVVEELAALWEAPGPDHPTVGVVTFNRLQAELIEDLLEARAEADPAFRTSLRRERERIVGGEDMGFFVKNVENVQGDERDHIIFSSTFGRNAQGAFRRFFGVLGQAGGERRLNVAVTRARRKMTLVTSLPIDDIADLLLTRRQASSARDYLQAYFEYGRLLSDGDMEAAKALLNRLLPTVGRARADGEGRLDGFEAAVAGEIRRLGWEPVRVTEHSAFGLDFAIEDPRTNLYGIGIECDAPRHPLLAAARAREMWRPSVLRRSIPVVHRVSSRGWLQTPREEQKRLAESVERALG